MTLGVAVFLMFLTAFFGLLAGLAAEDYEHDDVAKTAFWATVILSISCGIASVIIARAY